MYSYSGSIYGFPLISSQFPPTTPVLASGSLYQGIILACKSRIINPKRKSDIMTRTWHNVNERFASPDALRQKIVATFAEQVPESDNFSVWATMKNQVTLSAGLQPKMT